MQYRKDKYGNELSVLGYGCLRFTKKDNKIDIDKTEKEIIYAINQGVNYFDTAYIYGGSEEALGTILERNHLRDQINIATKLPHYLIKSKSGIEKYFNEELKRLKTDHVDYYLMHMLTDVDTWKRLVSIGIIDFIEEKKASGQIKQIGFSYHGNSDMFMKLIDVYDWDFCQIQYNYMDEHSQAGKTGLQYANKKGLPVIIMEPLRGGKLVDLLPKKAKDAFKEYSNESPASWAFNWLWNQQEVSVVLSGMNSLEMVKENCLSASKSKVNSFNEEDFIFIDKIKQYINESVKVGCTGCRYCMPCPKNVDIPGMFASYNHMETESKSAAFKEHFMSTALRKTSTAAYQCVGCGKCEMHCPQHIEIRKELKNASKELEGIPYKIARKFIEVFRIY